MNDHIQPKRNGYPSPISEWSIIYYHLLVSVLLGHVPIDCPEMPMIMIHTGKSTFYTVYWFWRMSSPEAKTWYTCVNVITTHQEHNIYQCPRHRIVMCHVLLVSSPQNDGNHHTSHVFFFFGPHSVCWWEYSPVSRRGTCQAGVLAGESYTYVIM